MAVLKIWPVKSDVNATIKYVENDKKTNPEQLPDKKYDALFSTFDYAMNKDKMEQQEYVVGINCDYMSAKQDFTMVKKQFMKEGGIQAYHSTLSFVENELTPLQCKEVGEKFAKRIWGEKYQIVMAVHMNTDNLHCHFVVNSISFKDEKRLHDNSTSFTVRKVVDQICLKNRLSVIGDSERYRDPYILTQMNNQYKNALYNNVRRDIDKAISISRNMMEFRKVLDDMGYTYSISNNRKYWTVVPKGSKKPISL